MIKKRSDHFQNLSFHDFIEKAIITKLDILWFRRKCSN